MVARQHRLLTIAGIVMLCLACFWLGRGASRSLLRRAEPPPEPAALLRPVVLTFYGKQTEAPARVTFFRARADLRYELGREEAIALGPAVEIQLPPGRYWMVGRAPGLARFSDAFDVPASGPVVERSIELEAASRLTLDVRVRREDEGLEPLARATVLVDKAPDPARPPRLEVGAPFGALTDAAGKVTFEELPAPPFRVRVFARGYEPYDAEVSADQLIALRPVHVLRVSVRREGKATPAIVEVGGLLAWPPRRLETNADGMADVLGLKAGRYTIFAEHGELIGGPVAVDLAAGAGTYEQSIELYPGVMVAVQVQDRTGAKVPGAHVSFQPASPYDVSRYGETNDEGAARLGPLRRAEGSLSVSASGFVSRALGIQDQTNAVVTLVRGGSVLGRVVDSGGSPISGAVVRIAGTDEDGQAIVHSEDPGCARDSHFAWAMAQASPLVPAGELGVMIGPVPPIPLLGRRELGPCPTAPSARADELVTDKDGRFAAHGVAPGTIVAIAEHEHYLSGRSAEVPLPSEGNATVSITLGAALELAGRVLDFRDFPVEGATVRALGRQNVREARTQRDGTFRLAVSPGELTLRVYLAERPTAPALEERLPKDRAPGEVTFRLPKPRESTVIEVRGEEGQVVELAQVKLWSTVASEPVSETRFTDENGDVEVTRVRGLRARVKISAPGYAPLEVTRELGLALRLTLSKAVRVEGRVTSVRGRAPAPSAKLTLTCGGESYTTLSGETGEYVFAGVPRGACGLHAHHESLGSGELNVTVQRTEHGRAFTLPDLDLAAPEEYFGRVTDVRGDPVAGAIVSAVPIPPYLPREDALLPEPVVTTDARGEFRLALSPGQTHRLYAALAAQGSGSTPLGPRSEDGLVIQLSDEDRAPADVLATVLVGLEETQGKLTLTAVLSKNRGTKGLRAGDVLLEVDREKPKSVADARELLSGAVGGEAQLLIERSGQALHVIASRETFRRR